MLFNWQVEDVCIVWRWWHVSTVWGLFLSCFILFGIAVGYEYVRMVSNRLDQRWYDAATKCMLDDNLEDSENTELLHSTTPRMAKKRLLTRNQALARSAIYAFLVAVSFWLMLVFMTYNGYLMIAIILGAGVGHFLFGQEFFVASRSIQCH
ncbi:Ctr copper transporter [Dichotomocladium elegans]|nr:Ctr copper transporter [Dichotomocladium elegans]